MNFNTFQFKVPFLRSFSQKVSEKEFFQKRKSVFSQNFEV